MTLLASSDGWPAGRRVASGRICFQGTARDVVAGDDGGGRLYESAAGAGDEVQIDQTRLISQLLCGESSRTCTYVRVVCAVLTARRHRQAGTPIRTAQIVQDYTYRSSTFVELRSRDGMQLPIGLLVTPFVPIY